MYIEQLCIQFVHSSMHACTTRNSYVSTCRNSIMRFTLPNTFIPSGDEKIGSPN